MFMAVSHPHDVKLGLPAVVTTAVVFIFSNSIIITQTSTIFSCSLEFIYLFKINLNWVAKAIRPVNKIYVSFKLWKLC